MNDLPGPTANPPETTEPARDVRAHRAGGVPPVPPSGRQRFVTAILRPGKGQVVAGVLLLLLGFAAVTQVRARGQSDSYAGARQSDLVSLLNSLSLSTNRVQRQINRLTATRDSLQSDSTAKKTAVDLARQQATTLGIIAGTLPATGPGVIVTIRDRASVVTVETLLNGVSELRDAGAEAIEINGTRVVGTTAFGQTSDGKLTLGTTPLTSPYVISVIGDSHTLQSAVNFEGGLRFEVRGAGARIAVRTSTQVEIKAVVQVSPAQYATPSPSE